VADEKKTDEKKRVVARKNFRQLKRKLEKIEELQKKHREWCEETCDKNDWWPREWLVRAGEVKKTKLIDGETKVVEILRAPKDVTKEGRRQMNEIENADLALRQLVEKIASKLHVPTNTIDINTGEITVLESDEATEVNLDAKDDASDTDEADEVDIDEDDDGADKAPDAGAADLD